MQEDGVVSFTNGLGMQGPWQLAISGGQSLARLGLG